jgi:hypothetical protein
MLAAIALAIIFIIVIGIGLFCAYVGYKYHEAFFFGAFFAACAGVGVAAELIKRLDAIDGVIK